MTAAVSCAFGLAHPLSGFCYPTLTLFHVFFSFSPILYLLLQRRDRIFQYQISGAARWLGGLERKKRQRQERTGARMKLGIAKKCGKSKNKSQSRETKE